MIKIDARLFAHILNDAFLLGSELQGNTFKTTIGYLEQYLDGLDKKDLPSSVLQLLTACKKLVGYEDTIQTLCSAGTESEFTQFVLQIIQEVQKLDKNDYLLFPGGWKSTDGGHAIIYQISKDEDGNLLFSVNNSGAGLKYHPKHSDPKKELYNPVLTYKIPKETLDSEHLIIAFKDIFIPVIPTVQRKKEAYNAFYLYKKAFSQFETPYLRGEIVLSDTKEPFFWLTGGQISGTCTQRSLHQMLKKRFDSLDAYRRFIYGFKQHALTEYVESIRKDKSSLTPSVLLQIEKACRHNLRILNLSTSKHPGEPLFTTKQIQSDTKDIQTILSWVSKGGKAAAPPIPSSPPQQPLENTYYIFPPTLSEFNPKPADIYPSVQPAKSISFSEGKNSIEIFQKLHEKCECLAKENRYQAMREILENFFSSLPLPRTFSDEMLPFYSDIKTIDNATEFFNLFTELQKDYFSACKQLAGQKTILPRMMLAKLNVFAVTSHINKNLKFGNTPFEDAQSLEFYAALPVIDFNQNTAYMALNDPFFDKRFKQIQSILFRSKELRSPRIINSNKEYLEFYISILNSEPEVHDALTQQYFDEYGGMSTDRHYAIRREKLGGMFYLFEHISELRGNPEFTSICKKFDLQRALEVCYCFKKFELSSRSTTDSVTDIGADFFALQFNSYNNAVNVLSVASENFFSLAIPDAMMASKYNIQQSHACKSALDWDSSRSYAFFQRDSNHTQLSLYYADISTIASRPIDNSALEARELCHLRREPSAQILLTLEYFTLHIERLCMHDMCSYIEANLFQPGLLIDMLSTEKNATQFFVKLNLFIETGLKHFESQGRPSQNSLFFLRLNSMVARYAYETDPVQYKTHYDSVFQQLNMFLECSDDDDIRASLHRYRFEQAMSKKNLESIGPERFKELLLSYFYLSTNHNLLEQKDDDSLFRTDCAKFSFKEVVSEHQDEITPEGLSDLLMALKIPELRTEFKVKKKEGAVYSVVQNDKEIYTINTAIGLIFKDCLALSSTPLDIKNHPLFIHAGISCPDKCFISADGKYATIDIPPQSFRFIKGDEGYSIQRRCETDDKSEWLQLLANSSDHAEYLSLNRKDITLWSEDFPTILREIDCLVWMNQERTSLELTSPNFKVRYQGAPSRTPFLWQLNDIRDNSKILNSKSDLHRQLSPFESPRFIIASKSLGAKSYKAELPRYGLMFHAKAEGAPLTFNWRGRTLSLSGSPINLGEGIASLTFVDEKGKIMLFPVQPFISHREPSKTSEYYLLEQDIKAQLLKQIDKTGTKLWQNSHTAKSFIIKIKDGKPYPETSAEALFLCYLYLGSHQPEKAIIALEDCEKRLGGVSGTFEELYYLSWIIEGLPKRFEEQSDDVCQQAPPIVACQLKALSLASRFKLQNNSFDAAEENPKDLTVNGEFVKAEHENTQLFETHLPDQIYSLFTLYQKMHREMPIEFILSERDRKSLLDFYHQNSPNKALGALGHEWVHLHFNTLKQEYEKLTAKETTEGLTEYDKSRKQEITLFIQQHEGVSKKQSRLEYESINLDIPKPAGLFLAQIPRDVAREITGPYALLSFKYSKVVQAEINALFRLDISDIELIKNFRALLKIAFEKDHALHEKLKVFCKSILIVNRHTPLDKQTRDAPLLCNVLYRICCANHGITSPFDSFTEANFCNLLNFSRTLTPDEILIPELRDDTSKLMVTPESLWKAITPEKPGLRPEVDKTIIPPVDAISHLRIKSLSRYRASFRALLQTYQTGQSSEEIKQKSTLFSDKESLAGLAKFQSVKAMQKLASALFAGPDSETFNASLAKGLQTSVEKLAKILQAKQATLLSLANEGPKEPSTRVRWFADIASSKKKSLDINRLLSLYFYADTARYKLETALTDKDIYTLHGHIASFLSLSFEQHQLKRAQKALKALEEATDETIRTEKSYQLAKVLFAENLVDVIDEPALAVLQYHDDILLHAPQKEALGQLLQRKRDDTEGTVETVLMGGGKSKVISPCFAKKKANGSNLVVIEVPRALLRTNYVDLQATSARLFNQRAVLFEFNRENDCSPKCLKSLYAQLADVMINQDYLVTTGESLQSLELKYFELLLSPPLKENYEDDEVLQKALEIWEAQVLGLERLVKLFKHRADVLIDEVHQGLLLKKRLNYTIGDRGRLSSTTIQDMVDLYQFFQEISLMGIGDIERADITLWDAVHNQTLLTNKEDYKKACRRLAKAMTRHENSPLQEYFKAQREKLDDFGETLTDYLLDETSDIPDFVLCAPKFLQNKLAIYKEQIETLLPYTLGKKYGENYGPSKDMLKDAADRACAKPYVANNVPNERSRFGNVLETVNYTIQSIIITGVPEELFIETLKQWQVDARRSYVEGGFASINTTPKASTFKSIVRSQIDIELADINWDDIAFVKVLHKKLSLHPAFLLEVLKESILPRIETDTLILHSDAYNHVDMFYSCQGMSGTPWNHSTFHQKLHYNEKATCGTDAYIIEAIRSKKPTIYGIDFTNTQDYLAKIFEDYEGVGAELRALIDISASFKGIANLEVAQGLAHYIHDHPELFSYPDPLEYILYFNNKDELSALSVLDLERPPVVLPGSSEQVIAECLGVGPEKRFTFYDQAHTIGSDVRQSACAKALVMIDQDTPLESFEQGSMRMRSLLEGAQTIDLITPKKLSSEPFDTLSKRMKDNEEQRLKADNFYAALGQMANLIRRDLKEQILAVKGENAALKKYHLLQKFQSFFVMDNNIDWFAKYGDIIQKRETDAIYTALKKQMLNQWATLLEKGGLFSDVATTASMTASFDKIIAKYTAPGMCAEKQLSRAFTMGQEVETQKEVQIEVETEKEREQETFNPTLQEKFFERGAYKFAPPLKVVCQKTDSDFVPDFDEHLKASVNYYQTYKRQTQYLNKYLKPVHALLWEELADGLFTCTLLSQQEIEDVKCSLTQSQWIGTSQHSILAGTAPENFHQNPHYQSLVEQVRYFNGEFGLLLSSKEPFTWLTIDTSKKFDFFEQHIKPVRETNSQSLNALKAACRPKDKIYQYIAKHPTENLIAFDFKAQFSDIGEQNLPAIQALARAFVYATEHYIDEDFSQKDWSRIFNLDIKAVGYVQAYADKLIAYKLLLANIISYNVDERGQTLSESLQASCPEVMGKYFPETSDTFPQNQDIQILLEVIQTLPKIPTQDQSKIIRLILLLEDASQMTQQKILELCQIKKDVHLELIKGHYDLTENLFDKLLDLKQTGKTLVATANHSLLKERHIDKLFDKARAFNKKPNIVTPILNRFETLSTEKLSYLMRDFVLSTEAVKHITSRLGNSEADKNLLVQLTRQVTEDAARFHLLNKLAEQFEEEINKENLIDFINHASTTALMLDIVVSINEIDSNVLALAAKKTDKNTILTKILNHPSSDGPAYMAILNHPHRTDDYIKDILKKSKDEAVKDKAYALLRGKYLKLLSEEKQQAMLFGFDVNEDCHVNQIKSIKSFEDGRNIIRQYKHAIKQSIQQDKKEFLSLLKDLGKKADELKKRVGENNIIAFNAVEKIAQGLRKNANKFFTLDRNPKDYSPAIFKKECVSLIADQIDQGKLKNHRQTMGKIFAVLNNILKWLKQLFTTIPKTNDTKKSFKTAEDRRYIFFDPRTDTDKLTQDLLENIEKKL